MTACEPPFRRAQFSDVPFVAALLCEFYNRNDPPEGISFDWSSVVLWVEETIRLGLCLAGPSSCAGAVVSEFPVNNTAKVAHVRFWYFREAREMPIFRELLEQCFAAGATHVTVARRGDDEIGRLYGQMGMSPVETEYMGELKNCCKALGK